MKYQMREQMFAIGDDYWIETDGGRPAFKVDGKALRIRKTLILEAPEGDEVFTIQKKLLSIRGVLLHAAARKVVRDDEQATDLHRAQTFDASAPSDR